PTSAPEMNVPDTRCIYPHSGGTPPFPTSRFIRLAEERKLAYLPNGPLPEFKKFYYELAQGNTPGQIAALLKMVSVSQVMYGTDFPFRDGAEVNRGIADWGFADGDLPALERAPARKSLPRVKAPCAGHPRGGRYCAEVCTASASPLWPARSPCRAPVHLPWRNIPASRCVWSCPSPPAARPTWSGVSSASS